MTGMMIDAATDAMIIRTATVVGLEGAEATTEIDHRAYQNYRSMSN
jgi:hypothetical protein